MGWRARWRHQLDADLADVISDVTAWFDRAADAAMNEPGAPQIPEIPEQREPEKPRDIMGGAT